MGFVVQLEQTLTYFNVMEVGSSLKCNKYHLIKNIWH